MFKLFELQLKNQQIHFQRNCNYKTLLYILHNTISYQLPSIDRCAHNQIPHTSFRRSSHYSAHKSNHTNKSSLFQSRIAGGSDWTNIAKSRSSSGRRKSLYQYSTRPSTKSSNHKFTHKHTHLRNTHILASHPRRKSMRHVPAHAHFQHVIPPLRTRKLTHSHFCNKTTCGSRRIDPK